MSMRDPEKIRSFLALELTEGLRRSLVAIGRKVDSPAFDVRWVRPENLHLTLRFLGEASEEELAGVAQAARNAAEQAEPFQVVLCGLGAFPARGSPRVVWVGVKDPEPLLLLEARLSQELERMAWPPPDKAFRPHLTLGRVKGPRGAGELRRLLEENGQAIAGLVRVDHLALIKSQLRSAGPTYTILNRYPFPRAQGKTVS